MSVSNTTSQSHVGYRVLRGPNWQWGDQDGGSWHVGTVVKMGTDKTGETVPPQTVVVVWDSGSKSNYRIGLQDSYDLCVYDTAPAGVKHINHRCWACKCSMIYGMRWRCSQCPGYDLCTLCYMSDLHSLTHQFVRHISPSDTTGVKLSARKGAHRVAVYGIFVGSKVVRGHDWEWGNQDGGKRVGKVTNIYGWENDTERSVVAVTWSRGVSNMYRVGHKGKVDVMCTTMGATQGGLCYVQHLPILGKDDIVAEDSVSISRPVVDRVHTESQNVESLAYDFPVGSLVRLNCDQATFRSLQEGHGGWNAKMEQCLFNMGTVHRITEKGDVRVQYSQDIRWTINPRALTIVEGTGSVSDLSVGCDVTITGDRNHVISALNLTSSTSASIPPEIIGTRCRVVDILSDVNIKVRSVLNTNHLWSLPRSCLRVISSRQSSREDVTTASVNSLSTKDLLSVSEHISLLRAFVADSSLTSHNGPSSSLSANSCDNQNLMRFMQAVVTNNISCVKELLNTKPSLASVASSICMRTSVHLASYLGFITCLRVLLDSGAIVSALDSNGDNALHYAAQMNQHEVAQMLLGANVDVNCVNRTGCTPLHVAIVCRAVETVQLLINSMCDLNIQDKYGNTALHEAVVSSSKAAVSLLVSCPLTDFSLQNKNGFTQFQLAALKGNNHALLCMIRRMPSLVGSYKSDGFTALHLASLNGHLDVVRSLLNFCSADFLSQLNHRNNAGQTALILAVAQFKLPIIEILVEKGARVDIPDISGNSALHIASSLRVSDIQVNQGDIAAIYAWFTYLQRLKEHTTMLEATICFLVSRGASLSVENRMNKSSLDLILENSVLDLSADLLDEISHHTIQAPQISFEDEEQEAVLTIDEYTNSPLSESISAPEEVPTVSAQQQQESGLNEITEQFPALTINQKEATLCVICRDLSASIRFDPCGHCICCHLCCQRMKFCLECSAYIEEKTSQEHQEEQCPRDSGSEVVLVETLRSRIAEMEEVTVCVICLERRKDVVFMCGHGTCSVCAGSIDHCHMCRTPITRRIHTY